MSNLNPATITENFATSKENQGDLLVLQQQNEQLSTKSFNSLDDLEGHFNRFRHTKAKINQPSVETEISSSLVLLHQSKEQPQSNLSNNENIILPTISTRIDQEKSSNWQFIAAVKPVVDQTIGKLNYFIEVAV